MSKLFNVRASRLFSPKIAKSFFLHIARMNLFTAANGSQQTVDPTFGRVYGGADFFQEHTRLSNLSRGGASKTDT
jgi:hypothetical protein